MSSIDVIAVFEVSIVPGLTRRNPSTPLNGARMSRSRSRATMLLKRACIAPARDRATSSSEAEVKPRPLKSCNRRNWLSASSRFARASASKASSSWFVSSISTAPAST